MPNPRDAERTIEFLCTSGIGCVACPNLQTLCREIEAGAGAALLTEEAILNDRERCLVSLLENEPPWSNFPLIVLTAPGGHGRHLAAGDLLNIMLVERPVRFLTLNSVVAAALRHRRHQYEIRDILSELKQAESALQTANRELEDRVRERTARLTEALRELETFSYIAHDMRAPLRAMRGFARILQEDYAENLPDRGRMYLQKIEDGSTRMDHLIKDILEYSRVARADLRLEPLDPQSILEEIATSLSAGTSRTRAIEICAPFPRVLASRAAFTQAASNLISNALKFVPQGRTPHVKIFARENPTKKRVRISFQDNGIGIQPKHQQQIFGIFQRLHLENAYEGTGIGLAIVRKAMERMGGEVGVESEPGKGSTFWLELPAAA
jgi:signal transduction histidine kinase